MKDERNVRQGRAAGGRWRPVAILLAAVLMVLSIPLGGKPAFAVDLDQNCSLTVSPGSALLAEDLATANVVIDLYRVADAVPVTGYDTYDWQLNAGFDGVVITKDIDSAGWKTAAQAAADAVLGKAPEGKTAWDPSDSIAKVPAELVYSGNLPNTPITGLKAGLYLIIAHGSDIKEYAVDAAAAGATDAADAGDTTAADPAAVAAGTVTIAHSKTYEYKFAPELISLPTKASDSTVPSNTADNVPWIYDATAMLKPSQEYRVGALDIVKTLVTYEEREKNTAERTGGGNTVIKDDATFIFDVSVYENEEAYRNGAAPDVYHDQVSITFNSYGTKRVHIDELPVDSYAVVTEIYPEEKSGVGHYYLIEKDGEKTIVANETVEATFRNDYNNENTGGGSVTNKFTYKADESKWGWEQVSDDSTDGSVIQSDTQRADATE